MRGKKSSQRRSVRGPVEVALTHPPEFDPCLTHTSRFRYLATTNVSQAISWQNLMDTQIIATGATTAVQMYDCVKVSKVELWSAATGGAVTCSVQFLGKTTGKVGDQRAYTDTALAVGQCAHVLARPAKSSQASQYQSGGTDAAFYITCTSSTVVDVTLTFRNNYDASAVVSTTNGVVGATAGDMYYRGLDGQAIATTKFVPQGVIGIA